MWIGVCGPNRDWMTDDWRRFRLGRFKAVKLMSYHHPSIALKLAEMGVKRMTVRPGDDYRPPYGMAYVERYGPLIRALQPLGIAWELWNEPNHPVVGGFGPDGDVECADWGLEVVALLRAEFPWLEIVSPPLTHARRFEWHVGPFGSLVRACDTVGIHVYWQYDNLLSQDWGGIYEKIVSLYPEKRCEILEVGDATPVNDKARLSRLYPTWARTVGEDERIVACYFFMLGGTPEWDEVRDGHGAFLFDDQMASALGALGGWITPVAKPDISPKTSPTTTPIKSVEAKMDKIEAYLRDMWQRQGVPREKQVGGFWEYALKAAEESGQIILPQPSPDGNFENHSDDTYAVAYTNPVLHAKKGEWKVSEGLPPF